MSTPGTTARVSYFRQVRLKKKDINYLTEGLTYRINDSQSFKRMFKRPDVFETFFYITRLPDIRYISHHRNKEKGEEKKRKVEEIIRQAVDRQMDIKSPSIHHPNSALLILVITYLLLTNEGSVDDLAVLHAFQTFLALAVLAIAVAPPLPPP